MSTITATSEVAAALARALRAAIAGEVDDSARRRAEYATDASNYRVPPRLVVFPREVDDVLATVELAREHGLPLTSRGAGTSVAGNSIGPGVVVDFSRHLGSVLDLDPHARTARVQPGVVMASLQAFAAPHRLRFGPDPSTHARATLGGMIGNNACGPHALAFGRTADNVRSLDVVDGLGRRFTAGSGNGALAAVPGLERLAADHLALLRTELGRFGRQVSGYSLEHLLPENGSHLARALVGTEGSVVTILEAEVELVPVPSSPVLVALGYPDMPAAADAVPALLAHSPLAIEGMDARLVDVVRRHRGSVPELPAGGGWLLVEVGGESPAHALSAARALAADSGASAFRVVPAGAQAAALWRIREDGAGLAGRTPSGAQAWPGWEDAAVPPSRLGAYLREFDALLADYGVDGLPYGHFGDGCVHVRIDVPLERASDIPAFRSFMSDAAHLVASHGGSLSGEHGDGRARGELLPIMYSPEALALFSEFKALLDPRDALNPGVIARPASISADLRRPQARPLIALRGQGFSFAHDAGDLTTAVHRCVGVAKCRADSSAAGGFMCPSYLATRDEKDSTRGRSRVLQELANGSLARGWDAPEVHESLDLCLSCKACSRDCPTGIDMAQYKSEVLFRRYRRRVRPIAHYTFGWLPRWSRFVTAAPLVTRIANSATSLPPVRRLVLALAGADTRRGMPGFATQRFSRWFARRSASIAATPRPDPERAAPASSRSSRPQVLLWVDSFSEHLSPSGARAMVGVLEGAGYDVVLPESEACCGLTWITTGQLDGARRRLDRTLDVLAPWAARGVPIVGVEPSCTGVLRSDVLDLFPDDDRALAVSGAVRTLAELLTDDAVGPGREWAPPSLDGVQVIAQPHCHHHSVMGYGPDLELLRRAGASVRALAGCCGLAGNFGMERGHYDVSVKVAEHALLPALRDAPDGVVYLADGFSCRLQADQLAGVAGVTLAELLHAPPTPPPRMRSS